MIAERLFHIGLALLGVALLSWLVSVICVAVWCDPGYNGYPDRWRSHRAELVYLGGGAVSVVVIVGVLVLLVIMGLASP